MPRATTDMASAKAPYSPLDRYRTMRTWATKSRVRPSTRPTRSRLEPRIWRVVASAPTPAAAAATSASAMPSVTDRPVPAASSAPLVPGGIRPGASSKAYRLRRAAGDRGAVVARPRRGEPYRTTADGSAGACPARCDPRPGARHPCGILPRVDATLTPAQLELQARARAFVRRRPPAPRGRSRARRRAAPGRGAGRGPRRLDRGRTGRRLAAGRGRRPGLVGHRAGPRPRAVRPVDRRVVVVHPGRLQRAHPLRRRSSAGATWSPSLRGERFGELRHHRAGRRLRRPGPGRHRRPRRRRPASTSWTARSGS